MPTSTKPRVSAPPAPITAALVPTVAAMDRYLAVTPPNKRASALQKAQGLVYDAWDATTERNRVKLCLRALAATPLCADAYNALAGSATTPKRMLALYQLAVEAAERTLGPEGFAEYAGEFWGWLETRPYMRARAGVAMALLALQQDEEAILHFNAMLELNPNDNQGIRYILMGVLLRRMEFDAVRALLDRYNDEGSMQFNLTRALLAFRDGKGDSMDARAYLDRAMTQNEYVVPMLTGKIPPVVPDRDMVRVGGPDEASIWFADCGIGWRKTEGAIAWLTETVAGMTPTP
jgi:tetratricopeptide (TPR) repeat protein